MRGTSSTSGDAIASGSGTDGTEIGEGDVVGVSLGDNGGATATSGSVGIVAVVVAASGNVTTGNVTGTAGTVTSSAGTGSVTGGSPAGGGDGAGATTVVTGGVLSSGTVTGAGTVGVVGSGRLAARPPPPLVAIATTTATMAGTGTK